MTRFVLVARLAMHELWISFRLLLLVGAVVLASIPAVLLPPVAAPALAGAPLGALGWYAIALAAALVLVAALVAATLAAQRLRGAAGWLVVRAVPRATILLAWYACFVVLLVLALAPAALVGWLSLERALPPTGPLPYAAVMLAAACAGAGAMALGLLAGSVLRPLPAAAATALLAAPPMLGSATEQWGAAALPGGGLGLLARLDASATPIADAVVAAGLALGIAAGLLVLALAAFDRAEL